jgi:hypothetical protein
MSFNIKFFRNKYGKYYSEIQINEFSETNPLIIDYWSPFQYKKQWKAALKSLYLRRVKKCILVTDVRPRHISRGLMYYALYAEDDIIFIREIMHYEGMGLPKIDSEMATNAIRVEPYISDRNLEEELLQGIEDGFPHPVSEWVIDFEDIKHLITK